MEQDLPERRRIVVDGSNIATEGRSLPSLAQLDEAIRAFLEEYPGFTTSDVTVVVDASFGHRIDPSEVSAFDQAVEHGEIITPPAGAIGRGDGFILRIAEKSGALVLSNDSFQEFHAERPWLFEAGRLIGGKPVPGVGWIFTPRTPVRGARSRSVTAKSKRGQTVSDTGRDLPSDEFSESGPEPVPSRAGRRARGTASTASATATKAAKSTKTAKAAGADRPAETAKSTKATATKTVKPTGATTTRKAAKAIKAAKAGKATKAGRSTTTTEPAKAAKAAKLSESPRKSAATSGTGSTMAGTHIRPPQPAKAAKAAKAAKSAKSSTPTRAISATKATKTSKASKGPKGSTGSEGSEVQAGVASGRHADERDPTPDNGTGRSGSAPVALNDPMTFLTFVADHPVGSSFDGTVVSFTSHGAHVDVDGMLCHVPLRGLAHPPPKKARQVLAKGETRPFLLVSLDAARRRAELALPGIGS